MDFIERLPKSKGHDTILVVVDRLSKYARFLPLSHPFFDQQVALVFCFWDYSASWCSQSIVLDCNKIFVSNFWSETSGYWGSNWGTALLVTLKLMNRPRWSIAVLRNTFVVFLQISHPWVRLTSLGQVQLKHFVPTWCYARGAQAAFTSCPTENEGEIRLQASCIQWDEGELVFVKLHLIVNHH